MSSVSPNPVLPRLPILLVSLWSLGVGLGLIRLGRGWLALRRALRDRTSVTDPALLALQADLAAAAGLRRSPRLTVSGAIAGPMAIGLREICLPARAARELTPSQMRGLLAHETAHLRRGDLLWLRAFGLLDAVFFFQPLQGLIRNRFRAAAEELCDDWAAARSGGGVALAQCLERVATWVAGSGPAPVGVAALAESGSALVRRVERLLGMGGPGHPPRFAAGLLLLLPPLAVLFLVPAVIAEVSRASQTNKTWSWSDGDRSISIAARGDIEFSEDGLEILSISPDGSLRIDDKDAEGRTVLVARPGADGRPEVEWTIDGEPRPFGPEGRAWLAALMQRIEDDREKHREARRAHAEAERGARQAQAQMERDMERAHREMERAQRDMEREQREAERELHRALEQGEPADHPTEQEVWEATQLAYEEAVRAAEADEQVARSGEQVRVDHLRRQIERLNAQVQRLEAELERRSATGRVAPTPHPQATPRTPRTPPTPGTPRTPPPSAAPRPGSPAPDAIPSPEAFPSAWLPGFLGPPAPPAPAAPPAPPAPPCYRLLRPRPSLPTRTRHRPPRDRGDESWPGAGFCSRAPWRWLRRRAGTRRRSPP